MTVAHVTTVAFQGIEARQVDLQVHIDQGLPYFQVVGLPDKAVGEARDRVRAALSAIGMALPPKRIVVNLDAVPGKANRVASRFASSTLTVGRDLSPIVRRSRRQQQDPVVAGKGNDRLKYQSGHH